MKGTFKWCPKCRSPLHHGQNIPHSQGKVPNTTEEQPLSDASARGHDFGKEKEHVEGKLCFHGWKLRHVFYTLLKLNPIRE